MLNETAVVLEACGWAFNDRLRLTRSLGLLFSRRPARPSFWVGVFFVILALFLVVTVLRFTRGLGATTNLSDEFPWGVWIGFDILCGVGLAAGAAVA